MSGFRGYPIYPLDSNRSLHSSTDRARIPNRKIVADVQEGILRIVKILSKGKSSQDLVGVGHGKAEQAVVPVTARATSGEWILRIVWILRTQSVVRGCDGGLPTGAGQSVVYFSWAAAREVASRYLSLRILQLRRGARWPSSSPSPSLASCQTSASRASLGPRPLS